jgi:hypothetical protein
MISYRQDMVQWSMRPHLFSLFFGRGHTLWCAVQIRWNLGRLQCITSTKTDAVMGLPANYLMEVQLQSLPQRKGPQKSIPGTASHSERGHPPDHQ